jgi:hypothetical protein
MRRDEGICSKNLRWLMQMQMYVVVLLFVYSVLLSLGHGMIV